MSSKRMSKISIDLTAIRKYFGLILENECIELELITMYNMNYKDHTVYRRIVDSVISKIFKDNVKRDIGVISKFYDIKKFNHNLLLLMDIIDISILNKVAPDTLSITFERVLKNDEQLLVEFNIEGNNEGI